jgi:hypothetical protein
MRTSASKSSPHRAVAAEVRDRILGGGERYWRLQDFPGLAFGSVAQALSRLTRAGQLQRLGKGLYYRPRLTAFGKSRPNPSVLRQLPVTGRALFPAGVTAANLLGFTTQNPARPELATTGTSLPRLIVGKDATVHTRRPEAWAGLSAVEAALLDFIRHRGETSEFSPEETVRRLVEHLREEGRYERLVEVSLREPPRVRAILGAVGEELGKDDPVLRRLRATLNPLSRFEFGMLGVLKGAGRWQAKEGRRRETV